MSRVTLSPKHITSLCMLLILISSIWIQTHIYLVCDEGWLLHVTQSLLNGGRYNQDFFETNPPMILYLYIPAIFLSKYLSISIMTGFRIYMFSIAILLVFISNILLKKIISATDNNIRYVLLIAISFSFLLLPAAEFGQRDDLMAMLTLPYLLVATFRAMNIPIKNSIGFIIGFIAGLGFAIKPYFLITPLFVEVYLIIRQKKWFYWLRSETIAIALMLIVYLLSIFIFTPEYITKTLPLVNHLYFHGLPLSLWKTFFSLPILGWILLICCYFVAKDQQRYPELDHILLLAASGFLLSYIVQRALWYYHWLPNLIISSLFLAKILINNHHVPREKESWPQLCRTMQTTIACFILAGLTWFGFSLSTYRSVTQYMSASGDTLVKTPSSGINYIIAFVKKYPNASVYFFTPFIQDYPLVDYAPVTSYTRFPGMVYLPGLIKQLAKPADQVDRKQLLQEKQLLIDAVITDFSQHPPTLIFADRHRWIGYYNNQRFDYLKFFASDARFAKIFSCYTHLADLQDFVVYKNTCVNK